MTRPISRLDVPADFQGIVIEGPAEVTVHKKTVARPAWARSGGEIAEYFGGLNIEGKAQIHTPEGKQYRTWFRFDKRLTF
ncbi:MAG TPA: hypothetical protein VFY22_00555, partial [Hydrogenophaga sp.]|nr:hypothetical protein [Hydrogenophaga sp.]